MGSLVLLAASAAAAAAASAPVSPDTALVIAHVASNASTTFRAAQGVLPFPYQVPAGPYNQLWDWDAMFLGVATLQFGSSAYFQGSFKNFLANVSLPSGEVKGCLTPDGATGVLYHAKPILIQAAYLAAKAAGDYAQFQPYAPQMLALLAYWNSSSRFDATTGLWHWHDQLESGCDNLVLSQCPSPLSPECWDEARDAFTLASPDLQTFIYREYQAWAGFNARWAEAAAAAARPDARALADGAQAAGALFAAVGAGIKDAVNTFLWHWQDASAGVGWYAAWNRTTRAQITSRTFQMAWPLWADLAANASQVAAALHAVLDDDLLTPWGVGSVSSRDPRFNNDNIIKPYSNWRGPVWINANAVLAYTLARYGFRAQAALVADRVVALLAGDLRATGSWHESYSSADGSALAADGFLSWDTLGATLQADVAAGVDPFRLD